MKTMLLTKMKQNYKSKTEGKTGNSQTCGIKQ